MDKAVLLILILFLMNCSNQNPEGKKEKKAIKISNISKGKLLCFEKNKRCGIVKSGQIVDCIFLLKNIGTETVKIVYYKASCNCTEVKIDKENIKPEDTLRVRLIIDTKGKFAGPHNSTVILQTNGTRTFYDLWANFEIK